jgi:CubicO group peptidase (beta-lactamase class C family)
MDRSVTSIKALDAKGNFATPHKSLVEGVRAIPWYNWDTMAAAGGIISSSNDMAKWVRVQLDRGRIDDSRRLFSEASSFRMWSPHTIIPLSAAAQKRSPTNHFRAYGLGWNLADYKGRLLVSHGGGYDGMYSQVMLVPEEKLGIVVLTNSMTGLPSALANTIVDEFLGGEKRSLLSEGLERDRSDREAFYKRVNEATTQKVAGTQPSRSMDAYVGTYRCPLYGDITVAKECDRLS